MGYLEVSTFGFYDWYFLFFFLAMIVNTVIYIQVYNMGRTRSYGYLILFIITSGMLIFTNITGGDAPIFISSLSVWSNRATWFFLVLAGFEITEKLETKNVRKMKVAYLIFSGFIGIITFYQLHVLKVFGIGYTGSNLGFFTLGDFYNIIGFHLNSFIAAALFTYFMSTSTPINKKASRSRILWVINTGSWAVLYIINFILLLISGSSVGPLPPLIVWTIGLVITSYLAIFAPENLLISLDQVLQAHKLYAKAQSFDKPKYNLGFNKVRDYLMTIPEDIWIEAGGEAPGSQN